jgi:hypothetical protein
VRAEERAAHWATLAAAGLVQGELPPPATGGSPWYVRLMLGVAGWIGAMFLFMFAGTAFGSLLTEPPGALTVGTMLCAGSAWLMRRKTSNDFAGQFTLAASIAGQGLVLVGFTRWFDAMNVTIAWSMAVLQAVLFWAAPNFVHRVWTAATGAFFVAWGFGEIGLFGIAPALLSAAFAAVWLSEFDDVAPGEMLRPAGYGLAGAAAVAALLPFEVWPRTVSLGLAGAWIGLGFSVALVPWVAVQLLRRERIPLASLRGRAALAGALILAALAWRAPGIGVGITILLLGFANGHATLAGFGLLALIACLVRYYYALEVTLLMKSAFLAGAGVGLLLARFAVLRAWPKDDAAGADGA